MDLSNLEIPEVKKKEVDGHIVAYRDMGKGYPVFCFPGWPLSSLCFVPLHNLTKKDLRLIAVDFPGWAGNTPALPGESTVERYTTLMHKFVESFGITKFGFMGYSFGNTVVFDLLRRFKNRPEKTVFVSSVSYGPAILHDPFYALLLKIYDLQGGGKSNDAIIKAELLSVFELTSKAEVTQTGRTSKIFEEILVEADNLNIDAVIDSAKSLLSRNFLTSKAKKTKSLFIYADNDLEFVRRQTEPMARYLNAKIVVVTKTDHSHMFFEPEKSADKIVDHFLDIK